MRRRLPPPNWLRAFEAAARHLSFTGAARELSVTQSAVSQQIRLLEAHLREPLFQRLPRGLKLTEAGAAYLPTVREAFENLANRTEEIFGRGSRNLVTIRANAAFAHFWLAPRLPKFMAMHPEIELRLNISVWPTEVDWEALSVEVRFGSGHWPGLSVEKLTQDHLFPVCSPVLFGRRPVRPPQLEGQTLLHVIGNTQGWPYWLEAAGQRPKSVRGMQLDTSAVAFEVAAAGGGLAIGQTSLLEGYLRDGRLVAPFDLKLPTTEGFYLLAPESRVHRTGAAVFRTWLLDEARQGLHDEN